MHSVKSENDERVEYDLRSRWGAMHAKYIQCDRKRHNDGIHRIVKHDKVMPRLRLLKKGLSSEDV